jgi:beta-glucosidase
MPAFDWSPLNVTGPLTPAERTERANAMTASLSVEDKRAMVSGDLAFWPGLTEMMGRYNSRPWPAGALRERGVPGVHFTDGPRGVALGNSTCFPVAMARGATWDAGLEQRVGDVIGLEARAQGANLVGAVCVNLLMHPAWGRAQETFGEDTTHVGAMGAALTEGIQRHAMACVKHFACNNIENSRFYVSADVDEVTLREVYLPHFEDCVRAGAASVMSAYNKLNSRYCAESPELLTNVLKGDWGFDGFVVSDFVFGLRSGADAFAAGLDIDMPFRNRVAKELPRALATGKVTPARLDDAVRRILSQQLRFASVGSPAHAYEDPSVVGCDAHRALAREVAARSMVLLQNNPVAGSALLPLDARALSRVAVLGALAREPNLGDRGSSQVHPRSTSAPLDALREALPRARIEHEDGSDLHAAVDAAQRAEVAIVVVGLDYRSEGELVDPPLRWDVWKVFEPPPLRELPALLRARAAQRTLYTAGDRRALGLSERDVALVRAVATANPATVVVLVGGSAIETRAWRTLVPAVVMAWYPGMEGGRALADVLLGREEPGGRLPCVFHDDPARLPAWWSTERARVAYGPLHGQRLYEARGWSAGFSLGHGLTYTRFERGPIELARDPSDGAMELRVRVTNVGSRRGRDLVAFRVECDESAEPSRLAGFTRVDLAPGESSVVCVRVTARKLARWEPGRGWRAPRGRLRFSLQDERSKRTDWVAPLDDA